MCVAAEYSPLSPWAQHPPRTPLGNVVLLTVSILPTPGSLEAGRAKGEFEARKVQEGLEILPVDQAQLRPGPLTPSPKRLSGAG